MSENEPKLERESKDIAQNIGILKERTKELVKDKSNCEVDPEEVGSWITAIGKAIVAIIKL